MTLTARALDFDLLDDLCLGIANGRLPAEKVPVMRAEALGPLLEIHHLRHSLLAANSSTYRKIDLGMFDAMTRSLTSGARVSQKHGDPLGWAVSNELMEDSPEWTSFLMRGKEAASRAGFSGNLPSLLIAAIDEFRCNIFEHSGRADSGYAAFAVRGRQFEFVVADTGVGVLASLRTSPTYAALLDAGEALTLAMTDGVSRFPAPAGRGMGFRPLLVGLANIARSIRVRSGDHSRELHRRADGEIPALIAQRAPLQGLFCSVLCEA